LGRPGRSFIGSCWSRPARVLVPALMFFHAMLSFSPAEARDTDGEDGLVAITSVTVTARNAGETDVVLGFNDLLPEFSIVANDVEQSTVGFGNTVRGDGARVSSIPAGPLKSIEFNQRRAVLTIAFNGNGPIHIVAKPLAGHALELDITPANAASQANTVQTAPTSVPQNIDSNPQDVFEVVTLKYADVSEIVGLLSSGQPIKPNDTFNPQEPAFGSSGFSNNGQSSNTLLPQNYNAGAQDAASAAYGQVVDDTIGVDRRLNAIILHGPPDRVAHLKKKIELLDVPVRSVVLETVFVELTKQGATNVGLDFNNANGQIAVATFQRGSFVTTNATSREIEQGYGSYSLQTAIYAQVTKGEGRIVSKPRISAQSGSTAKIITGDALPILTSIALSGVNAVSQQVQYVNVGVTLQIAPRVSADGFVTSHIFAEVSSVTGFSQGYPTISQREAATSATVKDGDSFVIGGLTQETSLTTKSHVPILGSIPLLGTLFSLDQESDAKTDLYIVVTPHVVQNGGDEQRPVDTSEQPH